MGIAHFLDLFVDLGDFEVIQQGQRLSLRSSQSESG